MSFIESLKTYFDTYGENADYTQKQIISLIDIALMLVNSLSVRKAAFRASDTTTNQSRKV